MSEATNLADQIQIGRNWTKKLIADVSGDEWTFQPQPGIQHILWICGHLAVAEHLLVLTRALGGNPPNEEFAAHFPIGTPVPADGEHPFPKPQAVITEMDRVHELVIAGVRGMSDTKLAEPCYGQDGAQHPHYSTVRGAVAHCARHEGFHAGQIALLRRLQGKQFLR